MTLFSDVVRDNAMFYPGGGLHKTTRIEALGGGVELPLVQIRVEASHLTLPMFATNPLFRKLSWALLLCAQRFGIPNEMVEHVLGFMYYYIDDVSILTLNREALAIAGRSNGVIVGPGDQINKLTVSQLLFQPFNMAVTDHGFPPNINDLNVRYTLSDGECRGSRACLRGYCNCAVGIDVVKSVFTVEYAESIADITGRVHICADNEARTLYEFVTNVRVLNPPRMSDLNVGEFD